MTTGASAAAEQAGTAREEHTVAVIIPVYNRPYYLRAALQSVLRQTLPPDEIIVVDDGSTDDTADVAESLAGVTVLRGPNGGVSRARNRGVEAAQSAWVAFLDSDDTWHPDKLRLQMAALERHPEADVCTCNTVGLVEPGADPGSEPPPSAIPAGTDIVAGLRGSLRLPPGSIIARRAQVLQVGGFQPDVHYCEDWDLWLRLAGASARFLLQPEPLLFIRAHTSNASVQSFRMMEAELDVWERRIAPLVSPAMRPVRRRMARSHFLGRVALVEREQRRPHLGIMARSLLLWPAGDWRRYRVFLHMLLTQLGVLRPRTTE